MANKVDVISAYINDEPFNLKQSELNYLIFSPQAGGIDFYGDILYTTEEQVKFYPRRVEKFLQASQKGWKYALDNVEEIVDLILEKYSQRHSREHLLFEAAGAKKLILPHVVEIGYMNLGRWQHILEKYRSLGIIKNEVDLHAFLYHSEDTETSYFVLIVQIVQILLVLLAIWLVVRFIRLNMSIEELDKHNNIIKKRLKKSKKRLARLMANLPGMAYTCKYDENWTMFFVSKGGFALTGYYPEELVKNKVQSYSSLILPDDRVAVYDAVKDSFHRNETFQVTYRIKCKNGQLKWVWEQGKFVGNTSEFKKLRIEGFIVDISDAKALELEREKLIDELQTAASEIKVLRGILPICANCKNIRDDKGYWNRIESYIQKHTDTEFSHGLCPDCMKKLYPEVD
jgi:PAS domain S-box-containing protein